MFHPRLRPLTAPETRAYKHALAGTRCTRPLTRTPASSSSSEALPPPPLPFQFFRFPGRYKSHLRTLPPAKCHTVHPSIFSIVMAALCHVMARDYIRCHCRIHCSLARARSLSPSASLSLSSAMFTFLALAPARLGGSCVRERESERETSAFFYILLHLAPPPIRRTTPFPTAFSACPLPQKRNPFGGLWGCGS